MTVASSTSRASYAGNGVTTAFTVPFRFLENSHLAIYLIDEDGLEHLQELTTDYTVSGAGDATGTVTMLTAPAVGEGLVILRDVPLTQTKDYVTGDKFPAESHEDALDKLTMALQQMQEELDRSMKVPIADEGADFEALSAAVLVVAGIDDEIRDVAAIKEDVETVAGVAANVTTVAESISDVSTVAGSIANVNAVADNETNVNTVAGSIANVNTVAGSIASVNTLAGLSTEISALYAIRTAISAVAADIASVVTTALNIASVNAVAAINTAVSTVAGIAANVTTVAGIASDVTAVADNIDALSEKLPKDGSEAMEAALLLTEVSTPTTPAAGLMKLYPKSDKKLYFLDSDGAEQEVGSGGSFRNTWDLVDEFGFDPSGTDGTEAANATAWALFAAHAAANPGHTYRGRKSDIYRISGSNLLIPGGIRLALEGAQFLWEGDLSAGTDPIVTIDSGVDWDALRFEIVNGSDFRRALLLNGGHRGGLLELIAQAQIDNEGGVSASDYAIRLLNHGSEIQTIKAANVDKVFQVVGPGDGDPGLNNKIFDIDIDSYVTGFCARNQRGLRMLSANIRTRSANATGSPGHNAIVTEGVSEAVFSNFILRNSGEHGFRIGGTRNSEELTSDLAITNGAIHGAGQTGFKVFTGIAGQKVRRCAIANLVITDSGDDGDAVGFNDHGLMLQQMVDSTVSNVVVTIDSRSDSSYDGVFISGATRLVMDAVQVYEAARNGCRISEFDDGTGSAEIETLSSNGVKVNGFRSENHAQEGVYIDCPATNMRDIHFENMLLVGGDAAYDGVLWNGAAARAAQPCRFAGIVRNHTTEFDVPATANIKTLDYMA